MHPLEIEFDALLCNVPIHPVPPDAGARRTGRVFESSFQRIFWLLGETESNAANEGQCRGDRESSPASFHNSPISKIVSSRSTRHKLPSFSRTKGPSIGATRTHAQQDEWLIRVLRNAKRIGVEGCLPASRQASKVAFE